MSKYLQNSICVLLLACLGAACNAIPIPTPAPTPEPTVLRFAYEGNEVDYQAMADEFHERYPDVLVELVAISLREDPQSFNHLLEQFVESDVVRINPLFIGTEQLDAVLPLDEFMEVSEDFPRQDFFPGSLEALQYQGRQLGVPAGLDPLVMFYENLRFKIASATPLDSFYTLDDFIASALEINNPDASIESGSRAHGFCSTPLSNDPIYIAHLFGGGLFDPADDTLNPRLNSPANVEAVTWYASLWKEHDLASEVTDNPLQMYYDVSGTSCGYWLQWIDMTGYRSLAVDSRVLPLPQMPGSNGNAVGAPAVMKAYFISKNSSNPQAAWKWIDFIVQREEASLDLIPPLIWQINSEEFAQRASPDVLAVALAMPMDTAFLSLDFSNDPRLTPISNIFSEAVREVVEGKAEVQTALDEAQAKAEEIVKSFDQGDAQP